jgi:hypothetical protein
MKKITLSFGLSLLLSGGFNGILLAAEASTPEETPVTTPSPSLTETPTVPIPILLKDSDKMGDSDIHPLPPPPGKSADGTPLRMENNGLIPRGETINHLADPAFLVQITAFNKSEDKSKVYYWHSLEGVDYCHFHGGSGSQWYGWGSGGNFLWALYHAGHFWWHDAYAGRWLYFDRGYWRWQGTKKNQFQVYLENGHYYACDANGNLGDDLFITGTEEDVTEPVVKETVVPLNKQEDSAGSSGSSGGQGGLDSFNRH